MLVNVQCWRVRATIPSYLDAFSTCPLVEIVAATGSHAYTFRTDDVKAAGAELSLAPQP